MANIRTLRILEYVKARKTCSMKELMEKFKISAATLHRDVTALVARNAVEHVHGGILYKPERDTRGSSATYQERVVTNRAAKVAIAEKAIALIEEDDIVFLDSSTTVYELAVLLSKADFQHLTVITNAVPVMHLFSNMPTNWARVGLGGNYDPQLNSMLGAATLEELSRLNITKAFLSAFGLDDKVATTNHERQAELLMKVIGCSDKCYLAVDASKKGRRGLYRIADRSDFTTIISR